MKKGLLIVWMLVMISLSSFVFGASCRYVKMEAVSTVDASFTIANGFVIYDDYDGSGTDVGTTYGTNPIINSSAWTWIDGAYDSHRFDNLFNMNASPVGSRPYTASGNLPQWFYIDLQDERAIKSFQINCHIGSECNFINVTGSIDALTWTQLYYGDVDSEGSTKTFNLTTECEEASGITISLNSPVNASSFAVDNFEVSINITENQGNSSNCSVYVNDLLNVTWVKDDGIPSGTNNTILNVTGLSDGKYEWFVECSSINVASENTTVRTVWIDSVQPSITNNGDLINGSSRWQNVTLNLEIEDPNNYEAYINVTAENGTRIFSKLYNTSGITNYNVTNQINHTFTAWYTLYLEAADGHTAKFISYIPHININKELKFIEGTGAVTISPKNKNDFSLVTTQKQPDRYTFKFERAKINDKGYDEFIVGTKEGEIIEVPNSEYPGHLIIKKGRMSDWYWIDFATKEGYDVEVERKNSKEYLVRVYGDGVSDYTFYSLGKLNVNNLTITYYFDASNVAVTESYEDSLISGFSSSYGITTTFNPSRYNSTLQQPLAFLNWNGTTIYSLTPTSYNATQAIFNKSITPSYPGYTTRITHNWTVSLKNQTNTTINASTSSQNQTLYNIMIGSCASPLLNYTLANFTYYDEFSLANIRAKNTYQLHFYDGTYTYDVSGNFTGLKNSLCTNLQSPATNYSFLMYGTFTLTNSSYITKVYTFGIGDAYSVGNYFSTHIPLYMINLGNSSTVSYTWQTTAYQPINGILKVYTCNANGSRSLVNSINIITGTAVANIQLIFQQYSYEVIIDGTTYTDSSFNTCHVESITNPIYYVNINDIDITPAIGLLFVDCTITQVNESVTMSFDDIGGSDTLYGCLFSKRKDIYGYTLSDTTCYNLTGAGTGTINYNFPMDGNYYVAEGMINDSAGNVGFCQGTATYPTSQSQTEKDFGVSGIFAIVLLVLSLALIYSEDGNTMLFAAIVGLVASWLLGIFSVGWEIMSLLVFFMAIIAFIGRYTRKGG